MIWRTLIVVIVVATTLGCTLVWGVQITGPVGAGEKDLTVPSADLTSEGVTKRTDSKVPVVDAAPKGKVVDLPANLYLVKMSGKKVYRMRMYAANQKELDAFLVVKDTEGKQIAFDDDGGGGLNAFLVFFPAKDGVYKVYAAAHQGAGNFTLRISSEAAPQTN